MEHILAARERPMEKQQETPSMCRKQWELGPRAGHWWCPLQWPRAVWWRYVASEREGHRGLIHHCRGQGKGWRAEQRPEASICDRQEYWTQQKKNWVTYTRERGWLVARVGAGNADLLAPGLQCCLPPSHRHAPVWLGCWPYWQHCL